VKQIEVKTSKINLRKNQDLLDIPPLNCGIPLVGKKKECRRSSKSQEVCCSEKKLKKSKGYEETSCYF